MHTPPSKMLQRQEQWEQAIHWLVGNTSALLSCLWSHPKSWNIKISAIVMLRIFDVDTWPRFHLILALIPPRSLGQNVGKQKGERQEVERASCAIVLIYFWKKSAQIGTERRTEFVNCLAVTKGEKLQNNTKFWVILPICCAWGMWQLRKLSRWVSYLHDTE